MPRANRYILPGHTYHLTHRCHNRAFLQSGSDHDNGLICSALQSCEAFWKGLACDFRGRFSAVRVDRVW